MLIKTSKIYIAAIWFCLTFIFTLLMIISVSYLTHEHSQNPDYLGWVLFDILPLLWLLIFLERWLSYVLTGQNISTKAGFYQYILASIITPLRFAQFLALDRKILYKLEQNFIYPILILSLILLPLWVYLKLNTELNPLFWHFYWVISSLIITLWLLELSFILANTAHPLKYLTRHWLDLLIFFHPLTALNRLIIVFNLPAYYNAIDTHIVRFMFLLKIIFLGIAAVLIQYMQTDEIMQTLHYRAEMLMILLWLWAVFGLERLIYLALCPNKTWRSFVAALFIILFPPLHLAARRCHTKQYIWYFTHWELVKEPLFHKIDRQFLTWIIILLIFMTPLWIMEIFFSKVVQEHILLRHVINLGNAAVWAVFVAEFIIEISITKKWQQYIIKHWIELLIILLPMLAFARFIRLAQLGSLSKLGMLQNLVISSAVKLQHLLNVYRARSTINRLIKLLILIDIIRRWQQRRNPHKYLARLKEQLSEKQQELAEIKIKIAETQKLIDEQEQKTT
jgi:hypothetical protein